MSWDDDAWQIGPSYSNSSSEDEDDSAMDVVEESLEMNDVEPIPSAENPPGTMTETATVPRTRRDKTVVLTTRGDPKPTPAPTPTTMNNNDQVAIMQAVRRLSVVLGSAARRPELGGVFAIYDPTIRVLNQHYLAHVLRNSARKYKGTDAIPRSHWFLEVVPLLRRAEGLVELDAYLRRGERVNAVALLADIERDLVPDEIMLDPESHTQQGRFLANPHITNDVRTLASGPGLEIVNYLVREMGGILASLPSASDTRMGRQHLAWRMLLRTAAENAKYRRFSYAGIYEVRMVLFVLSLLGLQWSVNTPSAFAQLYNRSVRPVPVRATRDAEENLLLELERIRTGTYDLVY